MRVPAAGASRLSAQAARWILLAAWLLHGLMLAAGLLGDPPRFGFAPALSVTAWLVLTVYAIESHVFPQLTARWALAGLGALAVLCRAVVSREPNCRPLASPWLPLHWALGIASYGLFAAAVVHAWLMTRAEKQIRLAADAHSGVPLLTLERLMFRFVEAGFVLLSATLHCRLVLWRAVVWRGRRTLEVGPQDRVLRAVVAGLCRAAGRPLPVWLARARARCACCTSARACCCWPTRVRASSWRSCWAALHEGADHSSCRARRRLAMAQ